MAMAYGRREMNSAIMKAIFLPSLAAITHLPMSFGGNPNTAIGGQLIPLIITNPAAGLLPTTTTVSEEELTINPGDFPFVA